ncbi:LysR family transcriptional regulator [Roseibium sp.]|uniref:LysR family transcriptional regulator n=1 Tax=Roseibium sp. TaxID=1936156 RepID=UPI003A97E322
MDAGDLRYLRELRTARTYSAAARALGVSHTTVARKVRDLETYFSASLIERIGDEVVLTGEGEQAATAADRISEELSRLERGIHGRDTRLSGHIRMATVDVLAWHFMPELAAFSEAYPDIELTIETDREVRSLSRREAEVALRLTNAPEDYLFGHEIGRFDFCIYGAAGRFSPGGVPSAYPWLEYDGRECMERSMAWMEKHAPNARVRASLSTPLMMLHAVQSGLGIGPIPEMVANGTPGLVRLFEEPCFSLGIWLLAPRELRHTARVRALFDALMQNRGRLAAE